MMKFYLTFFIFCFYYLFAAVTNCPLDPVSDYREKVHKKCSHAKKNFKKYYVGGLSDRKKADSYYNEVKYDKMRMHFDYTYTLPHEEKMLKELVMPPVKLFFENALKVRRFPGKIRFPAYMSSCQDVQIPPHLRSEGVEADLVIIVSTYRGMKKYLYDKKEQEKRHQMKKNTKSKSYSSNPMNSYIEKYFKGPNQENSTIFPWEINDGPPDVVGWSFLCMQDLYTLRPLAGVMQYVADINPTQRSIEEAVWTTLHEITHVLVMDYDLYYDFIDNDFNRLGYSNTLLIKSKLKGLQKMIDERQDVMDDLLAFADFNSSSSSSSSNSSDKNKTLLGRTKDEDSNDETIIKYGKSHVASSPDNTNGTCNGTSTNCTPPEKFNLSNINTTDEYSVFTSTFIFDLAELLKFMQPAIKLPVMDEYEEIKIPAKFNITTIILYISNFLENTKIFIKTPRVVEMASTHFGCPSLKGLELEHFGSIGSALSHWGKRIMNTEYMIADSYGENYISHMTLALMEDSGWYKVDYSKAEAIPWGRRKGCEFLEEKCIEQKKSKAKFFSVAASTSGNKSAINPETLYDSSFREEFCTSFDEEKCSISHVFRAICAINTHYTNIPKQFQYFGSANIGGLVEFGDYCPYPIEWMDPNSMAPMGSCRNGVQLREEIGEKICENCRCFHSSLVEEKTYSSLKKISHPKTNNETQAKYHQLDETRAACYEAKCRIDNQGRQELRIIVNDFEIVCPRGGAVLTIDGYRGTIECPKVDAVCFGTLNLKEDLANSSGYNLFAHLSEKLLSILYDFITNFFSSNKEIKTTNT